MDALFLRLRQIKTLPITLFALITLLVGCCSSPSGPSTPLVPFTPTLEWIQPTRGVVMDVNPKYVFSLGELRVSGQNRGATQTYNHDGTLNGSRVESSGESGLVREMVADDQPHAGYVSIEDFPINDSPNWLSRGSTITNPYTRYNTVFGKPDTDPYPWSGYRYVVGPSIAKGQKYLSWYWANGVVTYTGSFGRCTWMVGTFTDEFQPKVDNGTNVLNITKTDFKNTCPTYGKADCFIVLVNYGYGAPFLHHQWGGTENDLAYDVASDDVGNPTIFLRAGSEFGITSATQSIVRMKTGYNIVTLDTNGLLTKTYPVPLEATGEITDAKIALGKSGSVYILALDEARKQYFLTKTSQAGTAWTHYLPKEVGTASLGGNTGGREGRMDLCADGNDNIYITGNVYNTVDFGNGTTLTAQTPPAQGHDAFVAKYSPQNVCLGALSLGSGMGVTIRLSPDETALYVNGWATGKIMGVDIPDQSDPRNGVLRPGAFLVKLKLGK